MSAFRKLMVRRGSSTPGGVFASSVVEWMRQLYEPEWIRGKIRGNLAGMARNAPLVDVFIKSAGNLRGMDPSKRHSWIVRMKRAVKDFSRSLKAFDRNLASTDMPDWVQIKLSEFLREARHLEGNYIMFMRGAEEYVKPDKGYGHNDVWFEGKFM